MAGRLWFCPLCWLHAAAAIDPSTTVLNKWPMIMAHDSATTYLKGGLFHQINQWTKTQADGGFAHTLDCGARAFDFRPGPKDASTGQIYLHHGPIKVQKEAGSILDEVVDWAGRHANGARDLVVLGVTEVGGLQADIEAMLVSRHIKYYTNCASLRGLTAERATEAAKLPGGGSVMAIFNCWHPNYNSSIACSGYRDAMGQEFQESQKDSPNAQVYTCYKDSSTKKFPLDRMYNYINKVLEAGAPWDGLLYTVQALWQETTSSVVVGELHFSSLLGDEKASGLNQLLAQRIKAGAMDVSGLGMLEVNNVCDSGLELLAAIFERRSGPPSARAAEVVVV